MSNEHDTIHFNLYEYTEKIMSLLNPVLDETDFIIDRNALEDDIKEILNELLSDLD